MRLRRIGVLLAVLALVALAGCSKDHAVTGPRFEPPPDPNSPNAVVRLFEWSWNHRDVDRLGQTLPAEFRFVFALADSAGNPYRDHPIDRPQLLACARHLFQGGGPEPPATSIVLHFDPLLTVSPDSRPGRNPKWHREVLTLVDLTVRTPAEVFRVNGDARFFVVRGDSALIPPDLAALGFHPDSTRWYIEQWNDETHGSGGESARTPVFRALPATNVTWGMILALYR